MKIIERIYNAATGETNDIERQMTAHELSENKIAVATAQKIATDEAKAKLAKETAQAKLTALGLSAEDLKALGL